MEVTDENTTLILRYGTDNNDLNKYIKKHILEKEHQVKLRPLSLDTEYFFTIELIDQAGNITFDDNNGTYHYFNTTGQFEGFHVPDVYTTIQAAIDDASDGDTIYVFKGVYYENVIV